MKRLTSLIAAAVLVFAIAAPAQTPAPAKPGAVEQELLKLFNDWMEAEVKADFAFIDAVLADDWESTDPAGNVWNKAQFMGGLKSGQGAVQSFTLENMKARLYGDTAIVTGIMNAKQTFQGNDISGRYQCTDTLIKRNGRWQVVATHLSALAQK